MIFYSKHTVPEIESRLIYAINETNESYNTHNCSFYYKTQTNKRDQRGNVDCIIQMRTRRFFIDMISRKVYLKISPNGPGSVVDFKLGRGTSILVFPFAIAAMIVAAILFIYLSSFIFQLGAIGGIVTEFIAFPVFSVLLTLLVLGCFNVKVFASDHIRSGNYSLKIIRDYVCECPVTQKQ